MIYILVVAIVINWTKLRHWGVEIWSKFRTNFDTPSVETSTKLRPNFDTPSVEVWSKVARYINEIHRRFDKLSTKLRDQTARPNFDQTSTKLRPNFDETSTLGVSKFGRNFDQTSILWGRNLVEISTKLRHPIVQNKIVLC